MFSLPLGPGAELRPLEPRHAGELAACVDGARDHLSTWTMLASHVVDSVSARRLLQHYADEAARDSARYFGIWLDGALVGGAVFRTFDLQSRICEVGGWLTPDAEGHGLVTSAFARMIEWAVRERGMRRVELRASPENTKGSGIARRLGMTREGVLRNAFTLNGERHDSEVWSILADEWLIRPLLEEVPVVAG